MEDARVSNPGPSVDEQLSPLSRAVLYWVPAVIMAYALLVAPIITALRSSSEAMSINAEASEANPLNQIFWLGLICIVLVASRRRVRHALRLLFDPVILLIFLYLGFAALSVAWSPVPEIAFRRLALQIIVVLALGIPLALTSDREAVLDRVLIVAATAIAVNFVAVLALPPSPLGHEGIYEQKNVLGNAMAFCFLFCLYAVATKHGGLRLLFVVLAFASLYALAESQSKTSLGLAVLLPVLVFLTFAITRPLGMNAALFILFSAVLGLSGWFYLSALTAFDFTDLSILLFNDETFTGRTVIWEFVLDVISRRPLIGQGYASFWGIGSDSIVAREAPGFVTGLLQAHNGYLDTLVETGAIGFSILLALIVAALFAAARANLRWPALSWLSITLVLTVICHNMLESSWFRGYALTWMLFIFAALLPRPAAVSNHAPVAPINATETKNP